MDERELIGRLSDYLKETHEEAMHEENRMVPLAQAMQEHREEEPDCTYCKAIQDANAVLGKEQAADPKPYTMVLVWVKEDGSTGYETQHVYERDDSVCGVPRAGWTSYHVIATYAGHLKNLVK